MERVEEGGERRGGRAVADDTGANRCSFGDVRADAKNGSSSSTVLLFFSEEDEALLFAATDSWLRGVPFARPAVVGGSIEPRCCPIESI